MRVKVGSEWIDSDDQPLAVQFTDAELEYVKNMNKESAPKNRFGVGVWDDPDDGIKWIRERDEDDQ